MTVYAKLKSMKDNFIHAASQAQDNKMIELWTKRADEIQKKINKLTIKSANKEYKEGDII